MKKVLSLIILFGVFASFTFSFGEDGMDKKISLKDAIIQALKNNLDLKIQKGDYDTARENMRIFKSIFIPSFSTKVTSTNALTPNTDKYEGVDVVSNKSKTINSSVSQLLPVGGTLQLGFYTRRTNTNSKKVYVNPYIQTYAYAGLSQPLLKNFGITQTRYSILTGANNSEISKLQLQQNVVQLILNTESAYWELVYAYKNLEVTKMALERAKDLLKQNEIKLKVGTIGAIDVLSSKAGVAQNESNVISAERSVQSSEEALKRILNMSRENSSIIPTDTPDIKPVETYFNALLAEALQKRPEYKQAKLGLKNSDLGVKYSKNQALPDLSFNVDFSTYGQGGTVWSFDTANPEADPVKKSELTFGDSVREAFKFKNRDYSFSLSLQMPLGFAKEKANIALARISRDKAALTLEKTENNIYSEVKDIIKEIESNQKLLEAQRIAMELEEENLKAEEKRLAVGISTLFNVQEYQRRLANAQTSYLRSTINYVLSLSKLNRIVNRTLDVYGIDFEETTK